MGTARERYLQALDLFSAEARAGADRLGLPSACTDWSIADVIRHVVGVQAEQGGRALLGGEEPEGQPRQHRDLMAPGGDFEAIDRWEELAARLRSAALDAAEDDFAQLPMATLDLALHAWDIRWAAARVGLAGNLEFPSDLLEWMEEFREHASEEAVRSPGIFMPAVEPPAGATRSERFVAWSGRDPRTGCLPRADSVPVPTDAS
ncbi:maleylpyruvate isomerase N-terminal domain-containing protein [Agrococcus sp. HG114]|uniref:maleylpyruvate isomerase N-terminal domain-containing protein n=1 Tax=Agrococcus sp. HG114 TaxID=2969757 RepID=UPI00215A2CCF|nr:maleylpyruvate isomerase N-terminal domain-containing protein [Agrococcus sp. HG114]MCR8670923.1 hypothetical protein [Agrococcus sp. HG114]